MRRFDSYQVYETKPLFPEREAEVFLRCVDGIAVEKKLNCSLELHKNSCYTASTLQMFPKRKMKKTTIQSFSEERLAILLLNRDVNADLLADVPHRLLGDLAEVYAVQEEDGFSCVTNELAEKLGYSEEELRKIALQEMPHYLGAVLFLLQDVMEMPEGISIDMPFYVLSNNKQFFGASAILYPGMLPYLRMCLQSDFYMIPSSVHEVLLVPVEKPYTPDRLVSILKDANESIVRPEERLSWMLYRYDSKTGEIVPVFSTSCP